MGIDLLNPAMLTALGAVAAPFIIHLLTKRRPRNWEFPTIRFLRVAIRRKSRIHRLHDLILLALRTAAILLIVLTFARPILRHWAHAKEGSGGNEVLILLDDSLSMGYQGNPSPFDTARAKAIEILDSLTKGDTVNLWFLTQSKPVLPHFSENLSPLETELRNAQPTEAAARVPSVLQSVREFLHRESARGPQIYVLSDFQRRNWAGVQPEMLAFDGQVVLIDTVDKQATNCAVTDIRLRPARPAVTENVAVTCQAANYAPGQDETVIAFSLEGDMPVRRTLLLPPYGTADVTFHVRFDRPGIYRGTVGIEKDRLPVDDRRRVVFRVGAQIPVLLISDADPSDARSGAYFLGRAVAPRASGLLQLKGLPSQDIRPDTLEKYEAVLISEVKLFSRTALEALRQYLSAGGSVIYFLARTEDRGNLLGLQGIQPDESVLPFEPGDLFDLRRFSERTLTFAEANYESPLLQFFRDPENGDLSAVHAYRFFTTKRTNEMSEILLTYSDGSIALAQTRVEAGNLVLANFSPRPDHSDLARRNIFPPLIHEMIKGLRSPSGEGVENHPGEAASLRVELGSRRSTDAATIVVEGPDNTPVSALLNIGDDSAGITIPRLDAAGFYTVLLDGEPLDTLAVNPHPDESDLRPLSPEGLARLTEETVGSSEARLAPVTAGIEQLREGKILWPYILLVGFFILLVEESLAYRWRTR